MILQALYELYERLSLDDGYGIAQQGYTRQNIAFRIVLNEGGGLLDVQPLRDKITKRATTMIVPGGDKPTGGVTERSVHRKVNLLRNDLPYVLGLDLDINQKLVASRLQFDAFKKYHLNLRNHIHDEEYEAVCRFLEHWQPEDAVSARHNWGEFANGQGVFQIQGRTHYVHERSDVVSWWNSQHSSGSSSSELVAQCLITGQTLPIARLHEPKIKRVLGSQTSGGLIVSFDKGSDAFASYGRDNEQGFNAPVSEQAAFRYATALNALTDGPKSHKHRFTLGDATVVFWTKEPTQTEDIFAGFASGNFAQPKAQAQDDEIRQKIELFLKALRKGRKSYAELDAKADSTPFYMLGLTGQAKGRIGIRFFYTDTISALLDNLRNHFSDLSIIRQFEEGTKHPDPEFPAIWQILDETCPRRNRKPDREQIPPVLEGPLLRAIITGTQYPAGLFSAVMRRIHADREVNYTRACVIAGYLRRNLKQEVCMSLDEQRRDPPYRWGRLFAVLQRIQETAYWRQTGRDLEKGIRDSYFSAACSTPAAVFPRLERLSTHHRRQLTTGEKRRFDQLIEDIREPLVDTPTVLSMKEQGVFQLGYYHQRKKLWEKRDIEKILNEEEKGE